jgi:uncharacterized phage protein (TIGR02218 family)
MKTASPTLVAYLQANNTAFIAELFRFTLHDGSVLRWTTYDSDLLGYSSDGPVIAYEGGVLRQTVGSETSTLDVLLGVAPSFRLPNGKRLPAAAAAGDFDGADVQIDRVYMATPGDTSMGIVPWFTGIVGPVRPASTGVVLTINSALDKMNRKLPRRVFSPTCPFSIYDAACGLARTYTSGAVLTSGSTVNAVSVNVATGFWARGSIEFLSGVCVGVHRTVSLQSSVAGGLRLQFNVPLPFAPSQGDLLQLLPGCDKTYAACIAHANQTRFGGFPFVPKPESVR